MPGFDGRPVWADIDLDALRFNTQQLVSRAGNARLVAVVKANAYGHGAVMVARTVLGAGAQGLAVICVDEGQQLRSAGLQDPPIWVLGWTPPHQAAQVVAHGLTPVVHDVELLEALNGAARAAGTRVAIHLEVETGLNRHGLMPADVVELAERARGLPGVRVEALFTHFAAAEEGDKTFTHSQHARLGEAAARLPWIPMRHCAASATVLDAPGWSMDAVRAGLALYGYHPAPRCGADVALRPVMSLKTRVARVMALAAGETVGYGRTWRAEVPARVALLMCGYADGLPRRLSGKAPVLIGGIRTQVAGRIAMDMCMVDVTGMPEVRVGDEAVLLGTQGGETVDADDLALLAETISWEILAGIRERVPRRYLEGGHVVGTQTLNGWAAPALKVERQQHARPPGILPHRTPGC